MGILPTPPLFSLIVPKFHTKSHVQQNNHPMHLSYKVQPSGHAFSCAVNVGSPCLNAVLILLIQ
jgi:hypothetical protein